MRPLTLPPYRGAVGGTLPVYSVAYMERLRKRYGDVDLVLEGRTRINNAIGYQLVLRGKLGPRTLYVRHLLLVSDEPEGERRGVIIELESTPAAGTPNAVGIGNAGPLKQAMRSFRFGTSREGGHAVIEYPDFEKVDMRVGRIVAVEDFPEARRPAWKLRIDFGPEIGEKRSSAQITNYAREQLDGRLVVAVVNFPPRQIGPVRSEVLVLGAVADDHPVLLLEPDAGSQPGDRIA